MPAQVTVWYGNRKWVKSVCIEGQTAQIPIELSEKSATMRIDVDMTGIPHVPPAEQIAALDGDPLDEYEMALIRNLRTGRPSDADDQTVE